MTIDYFISVFFMSVFFVLFPVLIIQGIYKIIKNLNG